MQLIRQIPSLLLAVMNGWCGVSLGRMYERQRLVPSNAEQGSLSSHRWGLDRTRWEKLSRIDRIVVCLACHKIVTVVFCVFFRRKSVLWVNDLMPILKSVSIIVLNDFCILHFLFKIFWHDISLCFNETAYFKDKFCFLQMFPQN